LALSAAALLAVVFFVVEDLLRGVLLSLLGALVPDGAGVDGFGA
jgi:hypothetical protein